MRALAISRQTLQNVQIGTIPIVRHMEYLEDNAITPGERMADRLSAAALPLGSLGGASVKLSSPPCDALADDALMTLVMEDDRDAFAVLYIRHRHAATALASHMCARHAIVEEIVQEAFLSFWRSRRLFDGSRGNVRGWVLGIVRNRAIDVLRNGVSHELIAAEEVGFDELLEAPERTDLEVGRRENARELLAVLEGLPPEQCRVIALAYYGGYTHAEIATMLDTPVGTVKGRMRLGLRKMAGRIPAPI
jgi:RNA polymerase sigma-70 factor, ECF subfamily